ncbi:Orn/Lys/Arg decarboxylase major region [Thermincola ferriacetica]|uniref:Orn/Lys/Arg decarboxylase major region n=1 Tax=Thermincola ferriacetica TaxID=281456 RepID=A0A0L6W130_9FIRM|nr:aminotransferase class I/II-fold pyridoxal phosphate-dependent enzyme [Thermincola ferriacetica]KNZ69176.1 Orn/Lys/Arg decarboxylase major region [Thermincola ferriacetica]
MDLNQKDVPIVGALEFYRKARYSSFHMPGHKSGEGIDRRLASITGRGFYKIDLTELPGLDDLHAPQECIKEAQELAAAAFGAGQTFFSVNGTSCGIQAAIMACCKEGDAIVLPRNAHRSALAGLILSGARPVWVPAELERNFGVPLHPAPRKFLELLDTGKHIKAVFCINPTYHGFSAELSPIIENAHRLGVPVIIDEAHGPHFHFHNMLPASAMDLGADIAIQSTHKMLTALNQGSMLHVGRESLIKPEAVFEQLTILQTTSPSYLILASLDTARMQMAVNGEKLLEETIDMALSLKQKIETIGGIRCAPTDDPCKLLISVKELGATGFAAAEYLRENFNVQVELADLFNILLLITFGNTKEDCQRVVDGLNSLAGLSMDKRQAAPKRATALFRVSTLPECELTPREAWFSVKRAVPVEEARGCISAEIVAPYPPGIPLLCPGEKINDEIINQIKEIRAMEIGVQGSRDPKLLYIQVVDSLRRITVL